MDTNMGIDTEGLPKNQINRLIAIVAANKGCFSFKGTIFTQYVCLQKLSIGNN